MAGTNDVAIDVAEANRRLVGELSAQTLKDPSHPYCGKHIGVVNGQVAVVADDLDELIEKLRAMGADREETFCFEGGIDYDEVQEIW